MAVLKYKQKGESVWTKLSNVMVNAFNIVQGKGNSQVDIMSQKAVTDELNTKQDISGLTGSSAITVAKASSAETASSADTSLALVASSATSASTDEYVYLEDDGGNPIKIKTDSFVQAMAKILASTDKGTSVTQALVGDANSFGATTISNLASVLSDATPNAAMPNFTIFYNNYGDAPKIVRWLDNSPMLKFANRSSNTINNLGFLYADANTGKLIYQNKVNGKDTTLSE